LARGFLVLAYAFTITVSVGRALFRDPFHDLHCWANCTANVFLVRSELDLVRSLERIGLHGAALLGVLAAAAGAWRIARATGVARRSMWFVIVPGSAAALAMTMYALRLLADRAEDPTDATFLALFEIRATTLLATALGVMWGMRRIRSAARAVTRLADELGAAPPPGSLGPALAASLGDEDLTVAYWLPSAGQYVDASGQAVDPKPARGQTSTAIVRNGQPVAIVVHDLTLAPAAEIGAAARLAVDNERLRAEVLARLADLRAARTRIVATADATRRGLERDLHDGAQQRLLAASYELRLACSAANAAADPALTRTLTAASEQVQVAIGELRELAHGIYPAILTEAGLGPALQSFAVRAPLPVEIDPVVIGRYPTAVETTAYHLVAAMTHDASRRSATYVAARIVQGNDHHLVVEVRTDGPEPHVSVELVDRVGALGGRITVQAGAVKAEIPCAS
jgi:signal transduction histidine kinase